MEKIRSCSRKANGNILKESEKKIYKNKYFRYYIGASHIRVDRVLYKKKYDMHVVCLRVYCGS